MHVIYLEFDARCWGMEKRDVARLKGANCVVCLLAAPSALIVPRARGAPYWSINKNLVGSLHPRTSFRSHERLTESFFFRWAKSETAGGAAPRAENSKGPEARQ